MPFIKISDLDIEILHKEIKNMHLAVYPPNGRVRLAVPKCVDDETIRLYVISKLGWLKQQIKDFEKQERQSKREYISGESHFFLGHRYLLNVIQQKETKIEIRNKTHIDFYIREDSTAEQRERMMTEWYRKQLKEMIPPLLDKWQTKIGVDVDNWEIKQMRTLWGNCNVSSKKILFNLELAKRPRHCIEFIVVHELIHLLEPVHGDKFAALMDKYLPQWKAHKQELNSYLPYCDWESQTLISCELTINTNESSSTI